MGTIAFLVTGGCFAAGAVAAIVLPGRASRLVAMWAAAAGSGAALVSALDVLIGARGWTMTWPGLIPALDGALFTLDPLGAFFLGLVGLIGLPSAIYAIGYLRDRDGQPRAHAIHALFNVFLAGLCMVAAAGHALTFLFGWELMAVASYLLVVSDTEHDGPPAGLWYAVMTHAGFLALLAAFFTLGQGGPLDFASLRAHAGALTPGAASAVYLLALLAFGSKAGLVPLHVWLPRAHPAAPSHVSALMSAVMVKLGVYGCIRVGFDLLPAGPAWWGGVMLAAGVLTALTGVLYSVAEGHLKRVLAYSTVENAGLIFVGLGFALLMRGYGYQELAAIGLIVCLLHALNHAVFKGLLFLGAGAVVHRVGSASLEMCGGLVRRMPHTALAVLAGTLGMAALPPLNGFPSEWLTFQFLVAGARQTTPELAIWLPLALAAVALVAGLAAVSAVRLFGITFLALPRSREAAAAVEAAPAMRAAMLLLASLALALGIGPALVLPRLSAVAAGLHLPVTRIDVTRSLGLPAATSRLAPVALTVALVGVALAIALALRALARPARRRAGPIWNCGRIGQSARSEYTAAAFAEPLKRVFTGFYRPTQDLTVKVHPGTRYLVRSITYHGGMVPWIDHAIYGPIVQVSQWVSRAVMRLQSGSLQFYLALLPAALVLLLVLSRWVR